MTTIQQWRAQQPLWHLDTVYEDYPMEMYYTCDDEQEIPTTSKRPSATVEARIVNGSDYYDENWSDYEAAWDDGGYYDDDGNWMEYDTLPSDNLKALNTNVISYAEIKAKEAHKMQMPTIFKELLATTKDRSISEAPQLTLTVATTTAPLTTSSHNTEDEGHWVSTAARLSGISEDDLREQEQLFLECPTVTVTDNTCQETREEPSYPGGNALLYHRPSFGQTGASFITQSENTTGWYRAYVWYILNLRDTLNTGCTCSPVHFCSKKLIGMNAEKWIALLLIVSEGSYTQFP
jgi:hypothetical protein